MTMTERISDKPPTRIVKVLVASPSDVAAERKIAEEVILGWHARHPNSGIMLDPVLWESRAAPQGGERVQGILNKQIVDQCDMVIGIFWTRIGTDTGVAPGGAVEEVEKMTGMSKLVMLYFSNLPIARNKVDKEQEAKLDAYRASMKADRLVWEYDSRAKFRTLLARHLDFQIPKWFAPDVVEQESIVVPSEGDADSALTGYQSTLKRQLSNITLTGSPALESFSVKLSDTFVSLSLSGSSRCETRLLEGDTQSEPQKEDRTSTPEEVMGFVFQQHPLLLVIGDPGSGKTTLLKYYALSCLDNGRYKEFGFTKPVNVFYLPLRDLNKVDTYSSLPASLSLWSKKHFLDISESLFSGWLAEPSTLVLLDGLDEISEVDDRIAVCGWIDRTVGGFTNARFVVTSRSTGYRKGDRIWLETGHLRADIMDFSKKQQAEFLHRWFKAAFLAEIPPGSRDKLEWRSQQEQIAAQKVDDILVFLAQDKNKNLRSLAGIPLLLQIMAMLWKEREYMPGSRLKLYDAALNFMLDYRDRRRGISPLLAAEDARRVLSPVSLWMQEELKTDEVGRADMQLKMQELLDTLYNSLPAGEFCRNLVDRAGVLVEYGDREYVFRHKSFREYLAGVQLVKNMHRLGYLDTLVTHFGDDWWQEVFRFFIGHVDDAELFDSFMQKLFDSPVTENLTSRQQDLLVTLVEEAPQRKIDALQKKLLDPLTTPNRQRYLLECLKTIGKPEALEAVRKFTEAALAKDAGILRHAADINENKGFRGRVFRREGGIAKAFDAFVDMQGAQYILIKGGTFTFSLTKRQETMPALFVAKYPVTNKLYRQFISYLQSGKVPDVHAVTLERYHKQLQEMAKSIEGFSDYLKGEESLTKLFASNYDDDKRFNKKDQPVIGVRWYAARAYCLWLSLLESNGQEGGIYRLPTEMEWEYAAAGKEGRQYPWGKEEPSITRANYNENEGATTSVGRYPEGATPEGLYDMAGNVWEWMDNKHEENTSYHALRGGSWCDNADVLRCSARYFFLPAYSYFIFGFRVVRSSPSS
jgi:formylglycine-generating enzyme required for sulfatase activity